MSTLISSNRFRINQIPVISRQKIESTALTPLYIDAKLALQKLDRIDEIEEILDKHDAIAHYAKQIKDKSLKFYAERVYFRAMRRIGELLESLSSKERKEEQKKLRMCDSKAHSARTIARIEDSKFEELVNKTPPPSRSSMIAWGQTPRSHEQMQTRWDKKQQIYRSASEELSSAVVDLEDRLNGAVAYWNPEFKKMLVGSLVSVAMHVDQNDAIILQKRLRKLMDKLDEIDQSLQVKIAKA
jgi:hypothetical protein